MKKLNLLKISEIINKDVNEQSEELHSVIKKIRELSNTSSRYRQNGKYEFFDFVNTKEGFMQKEWEEITGQKVGDRYYDHNHIYTIVKNNLVYTSEYMGGISRGNSNTLVTLAIHNTPKFVIENKQISGGYHYDPHDNYRLIEQKLKNATLTDLIF